MNISKRAQLQKEAFEVLQELHQHVQLNLKPEQVTVDWDKVAHLSGKLVHRARRLRDAQG